MAQAINDTYIEANGHSLTRYLSRCETFGVTEPDLKIKIAEQIVNVAEDPQTCANAVLALARQGVDAASIAV